MSKILASIADAEAYATWIEANCKPGTHHGVRETAAAARAEHAETVRLLRECIKDAPKSHPGYYEGDNHNDSWDNGWKCCEFAMSKQIEHILSRVGGGA